MPARQRRSQGAAMASRLELDTARLRLRHWRDTDLDALAQLCADPEVMRYAPALLSRDECAALLVRCRLQFLQHGFGLWALEYRQSQQLIGFCGLVAQTEGSTAEVIWRLGYRHWGKGLAREALQATLDCAFGPLGLDEVSAVAAALDEPAQQLLESLGMRHDPRDDFVHPALAEGHPLRRQRRYRQRRCDWRRC